jgi:hypothetical protein
MAFVTFEFISEVLLTTHILWDLKPFTARILTGVWESFAGSICRGLRTLFLGGYTLGMEAGKVKAKKVKVTL